MRINKYVLGLSLMVASTAFADQPQKGDVSLALNPFTDGDISAPSYSVGYFVSEELMPFAFVALEGRDVGDDIVTLGGGARFYMNQLSEHLRPFAGGALGIVSAEDTGFGLGAFVGVEAMITKGMSISGQVGLDITDGGCDGCSTNFDIGTSAVQFNFYF